MISQRSLLVRRHFAMTASLIALSVAAQAPAMAQTATTPPAEAKGLEEIIVTSQRQAQSLQDVPIAVSAFSADQIAKQGITGVSNMQFALPNISFSKTNFTGSSFQIRGLGTNSVGATTDDSTGIHVNDIPIIGARIFETEFFDIERVEVLRGPQGTQFGRNATGGVVNMITKRPTDEFSFDGSLEAGNYRSIKLNAAFNIPISETLKTRFAGIYVNRDGYTLNTYTGNKIDGRNQYALRGSARWEATPDTTVDLMVQHFKENDNRMRFQKSLCTRDVTGIYGCLPTGVGFETVNQNASATTILGSKQFLNVAFAPGLTSSLVANGVPLAAARSIASRTVDAIALTDLTKADGFAGVVNPADYRTVAVDFEPTYQSRETLAQLALKHDFGKFKFSLNAGYARNGVESTSDFNQAINNPITVPAAIRDPSVLSRIFPPFATSLVPAISQVKARLFDANNNIGVSAIDGKPNNTGFIGGNVLGYAPNVNEYDYSINSTRMYSIEGIVNSQLDGPFNFLLGANYFHYKATKVDYYVASSGFDYASALLGLSTGRALAAPYYANDTSDYRLKSWAVFGEGYYDITDQLKLTLGARFTQDKKTVKDRVAFLNAPNATTGYPGAFIAYGSASADSALPPYRNAEILLKKVTGRVVLAWNPTLGFTDDTNFYMSFSRGAKPGGLNPPFDQATFPGEAGFKPETINAFEIGMKNRLMDGRMQLNLTGFYYDQKDLQIGTTLNRTAFNTNADAKVWGVEAEMNFKVSDPLLVTINASYLNTKIGNKLLLDPGNPSGGRSDVLVIKDITNASMCVVEPAAGGAPVTTALATVGGALSAIGSNAALTPLLGAAAQGNLASAGALTSAAGAGAINIPGLNHQGAYGVCSALAGAQGALANPGLAPLLGGLPAGVRFTVSEGIKTDITGNQLQASPKFNISGALDYTHQFESDWKLNGRYDISYRGSSYARIFNTDADKLPGYVLMNLRVSAMSPDARYTFSAFVQNLTDKTALTYLHSQDQSVGLFRNAFTTEPRRFGASVAVKY
jgi:iron complex outermembrane recepter protein